MVAPVILELQKREPTIHIDLLALTTGHHAAKALGFTPLGYRDFAHWYNPETLQQLAAPLLADTRHPLIDEEESVAYLGINLNDLNLQLGEHAAQLAYAAKGRWSFMPLHFMRKVLEHLKPDVVVTTNSPRSEEAAITVAAELGIPSVCMVDLFSPVGDPFLNRTHYADAVTTISDFGKRNLVAGGVPAERIHVTGSPAFDSLADPLWKREAADDCKALGWDKLKVILWAGNLEEPPPGLGVESEPTFLAMHVEQILRGYVRGHLDAALVIRYHPNQIHNFDPGNPQERVLWSVPQVRHPHRDIHFADLVIVNGSTIGLEAAMVGKSVLSMDNSHKAYLFPLSDFGVSRGVPSYEALAPAIDQALGQPFKSEFAELSGGAAGRVVDLIDFLTSNLKATAASG